LAGNPLYNHYRCKDDQWIAIAHLDPDRYWPKVCKALGLEALQQDPRFNGIEARGKNAKELIVLLDQRFAAKTREEWVKILSDEGCIFTPVQTPLEVSNDPQALANQYFISVNHPDWGKIKMTGFPWDFSETPVSWRRQAPAFGQHSEAILSEVGYSKEEIARLKSEGVTQ
jgi:crotonobetainyl-CoA:carnitine CoA-transferase CaiB-like acyl-CoA transferase